jgi:hypothetical protein
MTSAPRFCLDAIFRSILPHISTRAQKKQPRGNSKTTRPHCLGLEADQKTGPERQTIAFHTPLLSNFFGQLSKKAQWIPFFILTWTLPRGRVTPTSTYLPPAWRRTRRRNLYPLHKPHPNYLNLHQRLSRREVCSEPQQTIILFAFLITTPLCAFANPPMLCCFIMDALLLQRPTGRQRGGAGASRRLLLPAASPCPCPCAWPRPRRLPWRRPLPGSYLPRFGCSLPRVTTTQSLCHLSFFVLVASPRSFFCFHRPLISLLLRSFMLSVSSDLPEWLGPLFARLERAVEDTVLRVVGAVAAAPQPQQPQPKPKAKPQPKPAAVPRAPARGAAPPPAAAPVAREAAVAIRQDPDILAGVLAGRLQPTLVHRLTARAIWPGVEAASEADCLAAIREWQCGDAVPLLAEIPLFSPSVCVGCETNESFLVFFLLPVCEGQTPNGVQFAGPVGVNAPRRRAAAMELFPRLLARLAPGHPHEELARDLGVCRSATLRFLATLFRAALGIGDEAATQPWASNAFSGFLVEPVWLDHLLTERTGQTSPLSDPLFPATRLVLRALGLDTSVEPSLGVLAACVSMLPTSPHFVAQGGVLSRTATGISTPSAVTKAVQGLLRRWCGTELVPATRNGRRVFDLNNCWFDPDFLTRFVLE